MALQAPEAVAKFYASEDSTPPWRVESVEDGTRLSWLLLCRRSNQNQPLFSFKSLGDILARSLSRSVPDLGFA